MFGLEMLWGMIRSWKCVLYDFAPLFALRSSSGLFFFKFSGFWAQFLIISASLPHSLTHSLIRAVIKSSKFSVYTFQLHFKQSNCAINESEPSRSVNGYSCILSRDLPNREHQNGGEATGVEQSTSLFALCDVGELARGARAAMQSFPSIKWSSTLQQFPNLGLVSCFMLN